LAQKQINTQKLLLMKSALKLRLALPLTLLALGSAAHAAFVGYDPAAPTSNFAASSNINHNVAYNISVTSDATYVPVTADPASGGAVNGLNFANLYLSTVVNPTTWSGGSTIGFEVNNYQAFKPGFAGYYNTSNDGFITTITSSMVDVLIPWNYFTTDPDNIGFNKISAANNILRLNLSQSFGYSVAGGRASYGNQLLGTAIYSAAATPVPEPSTYVAGALLLLPFGAQVIRRLRPRS
jgi:hypothetical protein